MTDAELIEQVGTTKLAELCETSPSAVSQWKRDGIPKPRRQFLSLALPDVFGQKATELADKAAGCPVPEATAET
jgi:hypothetical protein